MAKRDWNAAIGEKGDFYRSVWKILEGGGDG
jgi:hypothetical protein